MQETARTKYKLYSMNLELTTACPLRCPQCYCTLESGRHIDLDLAKERIDEAVALGLQSLNLSGGETLCYPHLCELISYASKRVKDVNIAISGVYFDQNKFDSLVEAGVSEISVSLNGSTAEINSLSRQGFDYAIKALDLLKKNNFTHTVINWVMHSNNSYDFPNMLNLAEKYNVGSILVLGLKPDSKNMLNSLPNLDQIDYVSKAIKAYTGKTKIYLESCYSNFLAYHLETKLFGNMNVSERKGCGAGRDGLSVNVDGEYTPCRHISVTEAFESMESYWDNSKMLEMLRNVENNSKEPCSICYYRKYCRHCQAISWYTNGEFALGFKQCSVYKPVLTSSSQGNKDITCS